LPASHDVEVVSRRLSGFDHLVVPAFLEERTAPESLPADIRRAIDGELSSRRWTGGSSERRALTIGKGRAATLCGLGAREEFDARSLLAFLAQAVAIARAAGARAVAVALPEHELSRDESGGSLAARGLAGATYRFRIDGERGRDRTDRQLRLGLLPPAGEGRPFRRGVDVGRAVAAGASWARDLGNTPPNTATPAWMARQARDFAKRVGARITVLDPAALRRRRMGGILAVGGGSAHPPRMVRIELGRGPRTLALVGKGVTFDSGGISIKPSAKMDEMKWDKSGACAVLGALEAISRLDLPVRVRAYLAFAENLPDGAAYRPGDIVRMGSGATVEILNTDAEGRLLLADALHWASSERPDGLLEFSTLTGSCVVALGLTGAGLFTPSDELAEALLGCAGRAGERLWRLPLWPEFLEEMRGAHSDLRNSGGRWGGASTAAAFLSRFVGDVERWAHVDIAGPAYVGEGRERRGATGYGVALAVEWLRREGAAGRRG